MSSDPRQLTGTEAFVKAAIQGSLIDLMSMDLPLEGLMVLRGDIYQICSCCRGAGIHIMPSKIEEGEFEGYMLLESRPCNTCRALGEIATSCLN